MKELKEWLEERIKDAREHSEFYEERNLSKLAFFEYGREVGFQDMLRHFTKERKIDES